MSLRRWLGPLAVAITVAVAGAGCGGGTTSSSSTTTSVVPATNAPSGGTASAVGVTPNQVTVGNVSILSGPIPGLFKGAPYGADAFFAYQNSQGGVNGRKITLKSSDDAFSCTQNTTGTQSLTEQTFAMVGSFSLFDNCGAKVLQTHADVPDVSESLDPAAQALPNNFSPQPIQNGWRTGPLIYYKQRYPNAVMNVGALIANVPSALDAWNNEKAAMQSLGYHISYQRNTSPLETDFTPDIVRMRSSGVQMIVIYTDITEMAHILNNAQQQNYKPQLIESPGQAYDARFSKLVNPGAGQSVLTDQQIALYLGGDRQSTPEVNLFLTWMNKAHPGFQPDIYSVFGWTSARLFTQALQAAGLNPTRAGVLAALRNIHSFDSNGLLATGNPADKKAPTCWLLIKVNNNQFQRSSPPSPAHGFTCDPDGYFVPPG